MSKTTTRKPKHKKAISNLQIINALDAITADVKLIRAYLEELKE